MKILPTAECGPSWSAPMKTNAMIAQRIPLTHQWLLDTTKGLTEEAFHRRLSYNAPPIGWHLWHIARFADRLQASFIPPLGEAGQEIWEGGGMAQAWDLDREKLGILESGMEMALDVAASLALSVGKDPIQGYASEAFDLLNRAVANLSMDQFDEPRKSVRAYKRIEGELVAAPPDETTTGADLVFHISHAGRHLGSIEALLGVFE